MITMAKISTRVHSLAWKLEITVGSPMKKRTATSTSQ